jgi:glycosyltransferase involved in cell wall biosynthesis
MQAGVLLLEARQGYPDHAAWAGGHLGEAADELVQDYPTLAAVIRGHRKALEQALEIDATSSTISIPIMDLYRAVGALGAPSRPPQPQVLVFDAVVTEAVVTEEPRLFSSLGLNGKSVASPAPPPPPAPAKPAGGCGSCAHKKRWDEIVLGWRQAEGAGAARKRVVVLVPLSDFRPSYSLVSVVLDQVRALALIPDMDVCLFVQTGADTSTLPAFPPQVHVLPLLPPVHHKADGIDDRKVTVIVDWLAKLMNSLRGGAIVCHDLVFQAGFTNWAKAWHLIGAQAGFEIYHVMHSSVSARPSLSEEHPGIQWRTSIPDGQTMVTLNYQDLPYFHAYFQAPAERFITLLNPRDVRGFLGMTDHAAELVTAHQLHQADVMQVYPVSGTRMSPKNVTAVVDVFAHLHKQDLVVRLVIADPHANGKDAADSRRLVRDYAERQGLPAECLVFVSESLGKGSPTVLAYGLDQASIRSLFAISNLFIFPSISEAGPLVLMEAALSGCLLVLNESLASLVDYIEPRHALWARFGSLKEPGTGVDIPVLAKAILRELDDNRALIAKQAIVRRHCWEAYAADMQAKMRFPEAGKAVHVQVPGQTEPIPLRPAVLAQASP